MKKYGMWIGAGIGIVIGAVGYYLYDMIKAQNP